ncbi:cysteine desulfurase/sulfurtransferase TusA family protein [Allostreptomyces psammosilenae]|uniref:Cysteine desulfurase n=1 Tax=Allostreptomyces psammosilenae TaxID=1892865 RepID=A0A853A0N8_9ACTN|nr:cysteine desulfurase/sulfurtransferase TusA family protein [Allostreptomyces psammosilenae]NYI07020.1 cysteine desulfurase [Allostreptomyces psammosilenae]
MPYFDAASTAPLHPVARQALLAAIDEGWADPARLYREGRRARMLLDAARETVAEELGVRRDEVSFTSSGTQAVHTGVLGALAGRRRAGRRLVVSAVEHSSVLHAADTHVAAGGTLTTVAVERSGRVAVEAFAAAVRGEADRPGGGEGEREAPGPAALACLQSANHEVGTEQPVGEVAGICREAGVPLLVDAAVSLGRAPVPDGWSLLTASARKWGGPSGIGLLVVRKGTRFVSPHPADEREGGRAPGFTDIPAAVAAAASLRAVRAEAEREGARLRELVDRIRTAVPRLVPQVEVVGDPVRRVPHIVTFSCLYVDGEALLTELDRAHFAVSSGSSCTSSTLTPSHVLRAMGVLSEGNVRVSLPAGTAEADVERFLQVLPDVVRRVRENLGAPVEAAVTAPAAPAAAPAAADPAGVSSPIPGPAEAPAPAPSSPASSPAAAGVDPDGVVVVDSLGRRCPIPVIELARRIGTVPVGTVLAVLSDDEAARLDVPAWCEMRRQEYLGEEPAGAHGADRGSAYLVRRLS